MKQDPIWAAVKLDHIADKALFEKAKEQGDKKAQYTNVHNPAGDVRKPEDVVAAQRLGTLADLAVAKTLRDAFGTRLTVIRYDDIRDDEFKEPDKFDIAIETPDKSIRKLVEVRSSIARYLGKKQQLFGAFRLLGWYASGNKPGESLKDYYFQVIFWIPKEVQKKKEKGSSYSFQEIFDLASKGQVEVLVFAAAPKYLLEDDKKAKYESQETLHQKAATYRTMRLYETLTRDHMVNLIEWDFKKLISEK